MNVLSNKLPQEALCLVVELLANSRESVVTISRYLHGKAFYCAFIDQCVHLVTSGQSWHSWKNSHELQCSPGEGTKSSRSTPSTYDSTCPKNRCSR